MAALILPSSSPPRGPAPVNWANPITRGLVIAYFASSNFDHAGTRVPNNTDKTNNQQSANQYGAAMRFTGSQALNTLTIDHKVTHNLSSATAMTVVTVTTAAAGAERPICGVWGSTKRWYMAIDSSGYPLFAVNGGAANRVYTSNVVTGFGTRTSLAAVWDGSSDTCKLYKAGAEISGVKSGSAQTAIGSHTIGPSIGSQSTGGTSKHSGTIEYVLVFNRALSDAEIRSISENPYQVQRPANDRLWLDVVSSGVSSVDTSVNINFNLLNSTQETSTSSWNVLTSSQSLCSPSYNILNSASENKSVQWNTVVSVNVPTNFAWDTLSGVNTNQNIDWNTLSGVFSNKMLEWNTITSVSTNKGVDWNIFNSTSLPLSLDWGILQSAVTNKTIDWNVLSNALTAQSSVNIEYSVLQSIFNSLSGNWNVLTSSAATSDLQWNVHNNVQNNSSLLWGISSNITSDLNVISSILGTSTEELSVVWNSAGVVNNSLNIHYSILNGSSVVIAKTIVVKKQDKSIILSKQDKSIIL